MLFYFILLGCNRNPTGIKYELKNYTVHIPVGWKNHLTSKEGNIYFFKEGGELPLSLEITIDQIDSESSLENYVKFKMENSSKVLSGEVKILGIEIIKKDYIKVECVSEIEEGLCKSQLYYLRQGDKIYKFFFGGLDNHYNTNLKDFDFVVNSFEFRQ